MNMEESLRCVVCKNFALDAVESICECQLLYCEQCARITSRCSLCNFKLNNNNSNNSKLLTHQSLQQSLIDSSVQSLPTGFSNSGSSGYIANKLARKLISQMKTMCQVQGCGEQVVLQDFQKHWRICKSRVYICSLCNECRRAGFIGMVRENNWVESTMFEGKEAFIRHVLMKHEEQFVSMFDEQLDGKLIL